jgi:hypothetical protein
MVFLALNEFLHISGSGQPPTEGGCVPQHYGWPMSIDNDSSLLLVPNRTALTEDTVAESH